MKLLLLSGIAVLPLFAVPAAAAPMVLPLTAADMLAQTHSSALIMNVTGTFRQLSGTLNFDPDNPAVCSVDVTFQVVSLALPNQLIRSQTMSAGFLDPAQYPTQHYVGKCQGNTLVGTLTMRGQTHPFNMAITNIMQNGKLAEIHTEGTLNRYDWGLNGLTMTVGKMIRVTNDISVNGQPPAPPAT
jgi:polyisoprenoid-binding protein YceI